MCNLLDVLSCFRICTEWTCMCPLWATNAQAMQQLQHLCMWHTAVCINPHIDVPLARCQPGSWSIDLHRLKPVRDTPVPDTLQVGLDAGGTHNSPDVALEELCNQMCVFFLRISQCGRTSLEAHYTRFTLAVPAGALAPERATGPGSPPPLESAIAAATGLAARACPLVRSLHSAGRVPNCQMLLRASADF